ncbi:MAG: helix-turn-helix domain-containing protein [Pseudomonadota bacterium]|nr:helix-turn-helix domain-containing protein [Pseudomonadota bacterium]
MKIIDRRKRGWFWASNDVFDIWGKTLGPTGIAVYLCLCRHTDSDGKCFPSYRRIAHECGITRRTAIDIIEKIVKLGLILREHNSDEKQGNKPNLYILLNTEEALNTLPHPLVKSFHHPGENISPPLVKSFHHPGENISPEGIPIEGILSKRNTTTTIRELLPEIATSIPKSSSNEEQKKIATPESRDSDLIFDFALESFTPEQQGLTANMLRGIENAQEVLDQFNFCLLENKVRDPYPSFNFFSGLITKAQKNEFVSSHNMNERRGKISPKKNKTQQDIDSCNLCDENGIVTLRDPNGRTFTTKCIHDEKKMSEMNEKKGFSFT